MVSLKWVRASARLYATERTAGRSACLSLSRKLSRHRLFSSLRQNPLEFDKGKFHLKSPFLHVYAQNPLRFYVKSPLRNVKSLIFEPKNVPNGPQLPLPDKTICEN